MIRFDRIERSKFFDGWTPGLILGVLLYAGGVAFLFLAGRHASTNLAPCLLYQTTGVSCPLCGGTTASYLLATGHFLEAFLTNPLVTVVLPLALLWLILWTGFGVRLRPTLSPPWITIGTIALVAANWAYVVATR